MIFNLARLILDDFYLNSLLDEFYYLAELSTVIYNLVRLLLDDFLPSWTGWMTFNLAQISNG